MAKFFSREYGIRDIAGIPFFDVKIETDNKAFIDPSIITSRRSFDEMCFVCHRKISSFYQTIIDLLKKNDLSRAKELVNRLSEPNETRLGFSSNRPKGKGVSGVQGEAILSALRDSRAMITGLIQDIYDCELFVEGINHDKVSDMVTNIIMKELAIFTRTQCKLHAIPTIRHSIHYWNDEIQIWDQIDVSLPAYNGEPIVLVPSCLVARHPEYDYRKFFNREVLDYLYGNEDARRKLEITLQAPINKAKLRAECPMTKEFIVKVAEMEPKLLDRLKNRIEEGILFKEERDIIPIRWDIDMLD